MNSEEIMSAIRQKKEAEEGRKQSCSQRDALMKRRDDDLKQWLSAHPLTGEINRYNEDIRMADERIKSSDMALCEARWFIPEFLNIHCPEDEYVSDVDLTEGGIHLTVEQYGDELIEGRDRVVSSVHRKFMPWDDFWQYLVLKTLSK